MILSVSYTHLHNQDLHDRCQYLNSLHLRQLKYKSANGTDLTVGLIPEGQFRCV